MTKKYLELAQSALRVGHTRKGRRMARQVLVRGINIHDTHLEAQASLVLGQAFMLESRFHMAHQLSSRAVELFANKSDATGEAEALAVVSYSASALGLDAEALKAASDGVSLGASVGSPLAQAAGLNYHGVASFWAGDFSTATALLKTSVWFAKNESKDAARSFQPIVNFAFCEVLRIAKAGRNGGSRGDFSMLANAICEAEAVKYEGQSAGLLNHSNSEIGLLLLEFESCFLSSRLGLLEEADAYYLACLDRVSRLPHTSWLQAIVWWARLERAKGYGDVEKAILCARAMGRSAQVGEHEQLNALARSLEEGLSREFEIRTQKNLTP